MNRERTILGSLHAFKVTLWSWAGALPPFILPFYQQVEFFGYPVQLFVRSVDSLFSLFAVEERK
jgi:hypothetical protein